MVKAVHVGRVEEALLVCDKVEERRHQVDDVHNPQCSRSPPAHRRWSPDDSEEQLVHHDNRPDFVQGV